MNTVETTLLVELPARAELQIADYDRLEPALRNLVSRRPLTVCEALRRRNRGLLNAQFTR